MRVRSLALFSLVCCLSLLSGVASGGEPAWQDGLSDRELALQRWFSYLTYKQGHGANPWTDWYDDGKQLDVTAFRYQFAFCGYGCAAMAAQTPAYRDLGCASVARSLRADD